MKIFLITDIHHGEHSNYPNLKGEDYVNVYGGLFREMAPSLTAEMDACDLVMNLGDFIHEEGEGRDVEMYKEAQQLLNTKTPVRHVAGNHDLRGISREEWASLVGEEKSYYSFDLGGCHHVVLDGNITEPRGPYYVPEEQLVWLENDLATTGLKVIVYCHHPLDNQDMDTNYYFKERPERASINNKHFVRRVFKKAGNVTAVFSGHTHFYHAQEMDGIWYYTIPSFMENDGEHKPKAEYAIATTEGGNVSVEVIKKDVL